MKSRVIGVCSWSLAMADKQSLIDMLKSVGLNHIQLDLNPYLDGCDARAAAAMFDNAGVQLLSGMVGFRGEDYSSIGSITKTGGIVPDELADERIERAIAAGRLGKAVFGLDRISTHAGFLPSTDAQDFGIIQRRLQTVADAYADLGLELLFETGQESAQHLNEFLDALDRPNVKVNFDPANMILYGSGDPIAGLKLLGQRVGQVHIKDATASDAPGKTWGVEVPAGAGEVDWKTFVKTLDEINYDGPLVIEREAGAERVNDIQAAVRLLQKFND